MRPARGGRQSEAHEGGLRQAPGREQGAEGGVGRDDDPFVPCCPAEDLVVRSRDPLRAPRRGPPTAAVPPQSARGWRLSGTSLRDAEGNLSFLNGRCRVLKSREHVSAFQVRVVLQDFVYRAACGKLTEDGAHRHPRVADARESPPPVGVDGDALEGHGHKRNHRPAERAGQRRFALFARWSDVHNVPNYSPLLRCCVAHRSDMPCAPHFAVGICLARVSDNRQTLLYDAQWGEARNSRSATKPKGERERAELGLWVLPPHTHRRRGAGGPTSLQLDAKEQRGKLGGTRGG